MFAYEIFYNILIYNNIYRILHKYKINIFAIYVSKNSRFNEFLLFIIVNLNKIHFNEIYITILF